jgi:hypothetical protein
MSKQGETNAATLADRVYQAALVDAFNNPVELSRDCFRRSGLSSTQACRVSGRPRPRKGQTIGFLAKRTDMN